MNLFSHASECNTAYTQSCALYELIGLFWELIGLFWMLIELIGLFWVLISNELIQSRKRMQHGIHAVLCIVYESNEGCK